MDLPCIGLQPWWGYIYSWVKLLTYFRCLLDDTLQSRWILPRSDNLLYQSSHLSYPSSLMLWGAFCYTQILSLTCDKTSNTSIFPQSQTLKWKQCSRCWSYIQNSNTTLTFKLISGTLDSTARVIWKTGGATSFELCFWHSSHLAPLYHKGV